MAKLILIRHGQSLWNKANIFTGWVDVPLSDAGIEEALTAGDTIADTPIDCIFISTLMRAQQTAMLAMSKHKSGKIPVILHTETELKERGIIYSDLTKQKTIPTYIDWRINERYYGELQGCNKQEMRDKYGDEQVHIWRRSYDIAPPGGESLQMTAERTLPCFNERIVPALKQNQNVLVSAHGNSLRSIVMDIEKLSTEQVLNLEIPTGIPRTYHFENDQFELISSTELRA